MWEKPADFSPIRRQLSEYLKQSLGKKTREWAYQGVPPKAFVEPIITDWDGNIPVDYKFHTFGGTVFAIQADVDRFKGHKRSFYTPEWTEMPFHITYEAAPPVPAPANLSEMLSIASTIGKQFSYARVDLYDTGSQPFFGEVTFYPDAGNVHFDPPAWDGIFGSQWLMPAASPA
ncbi:hypothetical protein DevBK_20185 [Devosia sp. BK]|nr:hypothetical protein [Devosia sp. BK]